MRFICWTSLIGFMEERILVGKNRVSLCVDNDFAGDRCVNKFACSGRHYLMVLITHFDGRISKCDNTADWRQQLRPRKRFASVSHVPVQWKLDLFLCPQQDALRVKLVKAIFDKERQRDVESAREVFDDDQTWREGMAFAGFVSESESGTFNDPDNIQGRPSGSGSDRRAFVRLIVGQADSSCNSRRYGIVKTVAAVDLSHSVFRRSIPQNFEVYVVTAPRWTASICLERKKEEFGAPPMKSFHHGAVTTYSSKFWGILLLKTL